MPMPETIEKPKRTRIAWIDALRGIAMYFVVLGHTFPVPDVPLRMWIYSFHMPLFFLVSGLTWREPRGTFRDYVKRSAKNLLLPYAVLNVVIYCMKFVLRTAFDMYKNRGFVQPLIAFALGMDENLPCIQTWFLPTLFLTQLLNFLIFRYIRTEWKRAVVISALFAGGLAFSLTGLGELPWHTAVVPIALMFCYAGWLWMQWRVWERAKPALMWAAAVVLLAAGWYLQSLNGRVSMNGNVYGEHVWLFVLSAFSTCAGVVLLSILVLYRSRILNGVGVHSMFYLGYHGFLPTAADKFAHVLVSTQLGCVAVAILDVLVLYPFAGLVTERCPILIGKLPTRKKTDSR